MADDGRKSLETDSLLTTLSSAEVQTLRLGYRKRGSETSAHDAGTNHQLGPQVEVLKKSLIKLVAKGLEW